MVSTLVVGRNTWADLEYADAYLDDSPNGAAWDDLDAEEKARILIWWFRVLERQAYQGTRTGVRVVATAAISAGGTGYAVGDVLTISGGTAGRPAKVNVTTVSGGVVTGVELIDVGSYTVEPTTPATVSGGGGSGATIALTLADQSTAFPRTGLVCKGVALPSDDVPDEVREAQVLLSILSVGEGALLTTTSTGSNEKRLKAGSAEVEFFIPTTTLGTRFPSIVQEVIGCILSSTQSGRLTYTSGVGSDGLFDDPDCRNTLTEGYS